MTNMETIVRPFAPVAVFPSASVFRVARGQESNEQVLGGSGGREITWSFDNKGGVTKSSDEKYKETGRESTKTKVENPDDSDQFVEFCQAKTVTLHNDKAGTTPTRTSSYSSSSTGAKNREYGFNYDKENKTCKPKKGPDTGCT